MFKFLVQYLIARLQPSDLISLGNALVTAGNAALDKQASITAALNHIRFGVDKLTK